MNGPLEWLAAADIDRRSAETLLREEIFPSACFHAQQCAEKAMKGFVRARQRDIPRIHVLPELLTLCRSYDERFQGKMEACAYLDRFYLPTRYPDAMPGALPEGLPNREQAERAVDLAAQFLDLCRHLVQTT